MGAKPARGGGVHRNERRNRDAVDVSDVPFRTVAVPDGDSGRSTAPHPLPGRSLTCAFPHFRSLADTPGAPHRASCLMALGALRCGLVVYRMSPFWDLAHAFVTIRAG